MKTTEELEKIVANTKTHQLFPSDINSYIKEFNELLECKNITYYVKEHDKWRSYEGQILLKIYPAEYGLFKKTSGTQINMLDKSLFIPLRERSFMDIAKKIYTHSNSPRYAKTEKGLLVQIFVPEKKQMKNTHHYFEPKNINTF